MAEEKDNILHMDATGLIDRKPQHLKCKRIFYYCVLVKHKSEIIKLTQIITSEHSRTSIGNWLSYYKEFVMKENKKWPLAIIVVDQSWTEINAIVQRWNNTTLLNYLQMTYDLFNSNIQLPTSLVIVKVCFGHFSKTVANTINSVYCSRKKKITIKSSSEYYAIV